jgi:hypothetical protein
MLLWLGLLVSSIEFASPKAIGYSHRLPGGGNNNIIQLILSDIIIAIECALFSAPGLYGKKLTLNY